MQPAKEDIKAMLDASRRECGSLVEEAMEKKALHENEVEMYKGQCRHLQHIIEDLMDSTAWRVR